MGIDQSPYLPRRQGSITDYQFDDIDGHNDDLGTLCRLNGVKRVKAEDGDQRISPTVSKSMSAESYKTMISQSRFEAILAATITGPPIEVPPEQFVRRNRPKIIRKSTSCPLSLDGDNDAEFRINIIQNETTRNKAFPAMGASTIKSTAKSKKSKELLLSLARDLIPTRHSSRGSGVLDTCEGHVTMIPSAPNPSESPTNKPKNSKRRSHIRTRSRSFGSFDKLKTMCPGYLPTIEEFHKAVFEQENEDVLETFELNRSRSCSNILSRGVQGGMEKHAEHSHTRFDCGRTETKRCHSLRRRDSVSPRQSPKHSPKLSQEKRLKKNARVRSSPSLERLKDRFHGGCSETRDEFNKEKKNAHFEISRFRTSSSSTHGNIQNQLQAALLDLENELDSYSTIHIPNLPAEVSPKAQNEKIRRPAFQANIASVSPKSKNPPRSPVRVTSPNITKTIVPMSSMAAVTRMGSAPQLQKRTEISSTGIHIGSLQQDHDPRIPPVEAKTGHKLSIRC